MTGWGGFWISSLRPTPARSSSTWHLEPPGTSGCAPKVSTWTPPLCTSTGTTLTTTRRRSPRRSASPHGYSRDHRPDLKQFVVDLMCTGEGGIPLFLRVADGNEADQATFAGLIRRFEAQLNLEA